MTAAIGRRAWRAVRRAASAIRKAHDEQVYMWECFLRSNRAVPTATQLVSLLDPERRPPVQEPIGMEIAEVRPRARSSGSGSWHATGRTGPPR